MHEPREEDNRKDGAVVFDENAEVVLEERTVADEAADIADCGDEEGDDDGEVETFFALTSEDLDALLQVDEGDVETEDVAGEARHVAQCVGGVGYCEDSVHYK